MEVNTFFYGLVDNGVRRRVSSIIVFDAGVRFYLPDMCSVSFVVSGSEELIREVKVGFV